MRRKLLNTFLRSEVMGWSTCNFYIVFKAFFFAWGQSGKRRSWPGPFNASSLSEGKGQGNEAGVKSFAKSPECLQSPN